MANSTQDLDWSIYPYHPVKALPIIFAIFLTAIGIYQVRQSFFRYRWVHFGLVMTFATLVWVAGFISRAYSIWTPQNQQNVGMFIAQFVLIIVGPPLYGAAEYFILARLLSYLPYHAPLHPGRVFTTFLFLSACVESLTANGAANSAGKGRTPEQRKAGETCLEAALILQAFIEVGFFSLVAIVEHRCRKAGNFPRHIRILTRVLYITSFMLLIRCIVRTIEGFESAQCAPNTWCGVIPTHEVFLWVFEVANITVFVFLLAIFHPGKYLPDNRRVFLDPVDGKTELLGPGFSEADKRPMWLTVIDPFNLGTLRKGKGKPLHKFWEEQHPVYDRSRSSGRQRGGNALEEGTETSLRSLK